MKTNKTDEKMMWDWRNYFVKNTRDLGYRDYMNGKMVSFVVSEDGRSAKGKTVNKFFEKNLNISETARDLFMHRNTLVYHLEKLQKKTGLDIRRFDDAMTLKIALMVERFIEK